MRKIMTPEEQKEREQKRVRILGLFMLLIMLGSTAGFAFISYQQDAPIESSETLQDTGNGWILRWNDQTFSLRASPSAVADIPVESTFSVEEYSGKVLYVAADSDAVTSEIASTLGRYASRVQPACYGQCERDLPEVNCNSTLIVWESADEGKVYRQDQCVIIKGDIRAVDAFIYRTLGVQ